MSEQTDQQWSPFDYPPVLYITYARNDPDDAPVLDVSHSQREARQQGHCGFLYRAHRLPERTWKVPNKPEYGDEEFIEEIHAHE